MNAKRAGEKRIVNRQTSTPETEKTPELTLSGILERMRELGEGVMLDIEIGGGSDG